MISYILFFVGTVCLCTARHVPHERADLKIIGGNEAKPNSLPYMVYYETEDPSTPGYTYSCGGSLITPSHVLTAAHCLAGNQTVRFVLVGAHNIRRKEPTQQAVSASNYLIHEHYQTPPWANDIAIIKLDTPVTLNINVSVANLPTDKDASKTYVDEDATAYGWGLIHDRPKYVRTNVLMTVDLKVISNADCVKPTNSSQVYAGDLCTDGKGPVGTCLGDSGGPLVSNDLVIGVTSRGLNAECETHLPSIYVKVASYAKWIENTLKKL